MNFLILVAIGTAIVSAIYLAIIVRIYNDQKALNKQVEDMLKYRVHTTLVNKPRDYVIDEISRQKLFFDKEKNKWIKLRQIN
tara:strand:- start:115 stop:360 length:246 start_codon:yes stop_codon:yes gene_type:complete